MYVFRGLLGINFYVVLKKINRIPLQPRLCDAMLP